MEKISILVPIYNVADKIERCAVSLFEQTYKDIEYVFVNDCTPDNSIKVLENVVERYPERKEQVRIIHHEKNKGLAGARNTGYDNATGDLWMVVDSDDWIPADTCEKLYKKLSESGADVVSGSVLSYKPGNVEVLIRKAYPNKEARLKRQLCLSLVSGSLCGSLYRKHVFDGLRAKEGVNLAEDYMMCNRVLLMSHLEFIDDVVYYYDETEVHDYGKIYTSHIGQLTQAVMTVDDYYHEHAEGHRYLKNIQMAYLYVIRSACQSGLQADEAYAKLKWWAKPIAWLMNKKSTFAIANVLYKIVRTIIVRS